MQLVFVRRRASWGLRRAFCVNSLTFFTFSWKLRLIVTNFDVHHPYGTRIKSTFYGSPLPERHRWVRICKKKKPTNFQKSCEIHGSWINGSDSRLGPILPYTCSKTLLNLRKSLSLLSYICTCIYLLKTKLMVMMSMKSSTYIVKLMVSETGVLALGWAKYSHIVKLYLT